MRMDIPFARPYTDEREVEAVAAVIRSGWVSQGERVMEFERSMARLVGAPFAIATNSCTSALQLSLLLQGLNPGDEVICPSFTCMATGNAIRSVGALPRFAEIDPRTFNLDPHTLDQALSPKTKGILVVHQIGLPADMDPIEDFAAHHGLFIVEDGATSLGSTYKGKPIGSRAAPTCFSFHPRKLITTGEGGMITVHNHDQAQRAQTLRSHGASNSDMERHQSRGALYATYPEAGFNYRMTDLQGAMGVEQLKKLPFILGRKREIARLYDEALARIPGVEPPYQPPHYEHSYQSYLIRLPASLDRDVLLKGMAARGISCRHGIVPLHLEPYYRRLFDPLPLPLTEAVSRSTMFLPIYPQMTEEELHYVVDSLEELVLNLA